MAELWGKLKVWGTDNSGSYWESTSSCYDHEVDDILSKFPSYDDYDFWSKNNGGLANE